MENKPSKLSLTSKQESIPFTKKIPILFMVVYHLCADYLKKHNIILHFGEFLTRLMECLYNHDLIIIRNGFETYTLKELIENTGNSISELIELFKKWSNDNNFEDKNIDGGSYFEDLYGKKVVPFDELFQLHKQSIAEESLSYTDFIGNDTLEKKYNWQLSDDERMSLEEIKKFERDNDVNIIEILDAAKLNLLIENYTNAKQNEIWNVLEEWMLEEYRNNKDDESFVEYCEENVDDILRHLQAALSYDFPEDEIVKLFEELVSNYLEFNKDKIRRLD